jgi:hypothetical protein
VVRSFALAVVSSVLVVSLAACGGAGAPTLAPGATQPPGGVPTQAPGGVPTQAPVGNPAEACAGQPTYSVDNPMPSFGQDTTLNSRFPTQIDGQPVTNVSSAFWLQSMCFYGSTAEEVANFIAIWPPGTAPLISTGSAQVELDGEAVYFSAFRLPGADPNLIFSHIPEFIAALGGDAEDAANTAVTTANVGGKNVYVVTDPDGDVAYNYVSGDTVWTVDDDEATAAKVFAAIQ